MQRIHSKSLLFIVLIISSLIYVAIAHADSFFEDVNEEPLFQPHIQRFFENHFVSGYTINSIPTGKFGPHNTILRSEFAKITTVTRLAEEFGMAENWNDLSKFGFVEKVDVEKLSPYYNCNSGACKSINSRPFLDVAQKPSNCFEDLTKKDPCKPWFGQYVYYAVDSGFIKGYTTNPPSASREFKPFDNILRIHALKMIMVDSGNIDPEHDERFQRLKAKAEERKSYKPKCLAGAENYIRDYTEARSCPAGNTLKGYTSNGQLVYKCVNDLNSKIRRVPDGEKLLQYALLADRLDLFGNNCDVFNGMDTPRKVADYLMKPISRGEVPRYFALTMEYEPVETNPEEDITVNTPDENEGSEAGDTSYSPPEYEPTDVINGPPDESVTPEDSTPDDLVDTDPIVEDPDSDAPTEGPVEYPSDDPTLPTLPDNTRTKSCLSMKVKLGEGADVYVGMTVLEILNDYYKENNNALLIINEFYLKYDIGSLCENIGGRYSNAVQRFQNITAYVDYLLDLFDSANITIKEFLKKLLLMLSLFNPEPTVTCPIEPGQINYSLESISPSPLQFTQTGQTKTVTVKIKNTSGAETKTTAVIWNEGCEFNLTKTDWRVEKNRIRKTERGFTDSDAIKGIIVKSTQKTLDALSQTITLEVEVRHSSGDRLMDQFHINNKGPSTPGIYGIYIYAERQTDSLKSRAFKTSIANVKIRQFPLINAREIAIIPTSTTAITVTGRAVQGQYSGTYKTYMWYPVSFDDGNVIKKGFVVASVLHADWVDWDLIKKNRYTSDYYKGNLVNGRKNAVILHFTVSNSKMADQRSVFNNGSVSTHFILGRDGEIKQIVEDFYAAWHASVDNYRSIGIEIINWGVMRKKSENNEDENWYNATLNKIIDEEPLNVKTSEDYKKIYEVWSMASNYNAQINYDGKKEYWQSYKIKQISSLNKLLSYNEERFDIPHKAFSYSIPGKDSTYTQYGFYFYPYKLDYSTDPPKTSSEWTKYQCERQKFIGIYGHHNVSGKYDPGPHLNLNDLKLFNTSQYEKTCN